MSTKDAVHVEHAVDALRAILVNQNGQMEFKMVEVEIFIGMDIRPELEATVDSPPTSTSGCRTA